MQIKTFENIPGTYLSNAAGVDLEIRKIGSDFYLVGLVNFLYYIRCKTMHFLYVGLRYRT